MVGVNMKQYMVRRYNPAGVLAVVFYTNRLSEAVTIWRENQPDPGPFQMPTSIWQHIGGRYKRMPGYDKV